MKISNHFKSILESAYNEYSAIDCLEDGTGLEPGFQYIHKAILFEERDLQRAINIYSHKRFANPTKVEELKQAKEDLSSIDIDNSYEYLDFFRKHYDLLAYHPVNFVGRIYMDCCSKKRASGKSDLRYLLKELWYENLDYQEANAIYKKFLTLCKFWVEQTKVRQQEEEMENLYRELL